MHIDVPQPDSSSTVASEIDGSDSEDVTTATNEDDMQSLVGVSISRAQTRLKSPRTPAAERAAAVHTFGTDGFFDHRPPTMNTGAQESSVHYNTDAIRVESRRENSNVDGACSSDSLPWPSPWTSAPKPFEEGTIPSQPLQPKDTSTARPRAATGPIGNLIDLNIKRFLSTFTMPSLPKPPNLRDFPTPALSALTAVRLQPQTDLNVEKRRPDKLENEKSHQPPQRDSLLYPKRYDSLNCQQACDFGTIESVETCPRVNRPPKPSPGDRSPQPSLRRATSDQSLALRKVSSKASSLGDDTRWEHVQKQVNSRAKAIADTLQDSSIRLPTMPSLPTINMSSFTPDFFKNRGMSDNPQFSKTYRPSDTRSTVSQGQLLGRKHNPVQAFDAQSKGANETLISSEQSPRSLFPYLDRALDSLTGDIVILGGYRGSVLRSAKPPHRQLWVPVKVGLNIRRVNLEVGLEPEDEAVAEETIIPSGMLSHIGPIDMGRRLLKRLQSCRNVQEGKLRVHNYGYDWRLSPHLLSQKLVQYLEKLPVNTCRLGDGSTGAVVIAHSLGGLITRHVINQRPELFAGVIYAGVPQHCINILGPLRKGDEVLLSSKVLTAQVNFTLRTSYILLPEDGRCFIDKQTKEDYPVNFFDAEEWRRHAFSPCIALSSPPFSAPERKNLLSVVTDNLALLPLIGRKEPSVKPTSKYQTTRINPEGFALTDPGSHPDESDHTNGTSSSSHVTIPPDKAWLYLKRTLASSHRFKEELRFRSQHAHANMYPPFSVLYSTSVPTVFRARVASKAAIRCQDAYDDLQFASGDGVCLARAAMLPEGYNCVEGGKVRTERGHVGLLGDLEAVGKCLVSVIEARQKGVGMGSVQLSRDKNGRSRSS
ncbi:MAG: hypothetical protein Q9220_004374 [cf. Caloplaca sp. 1 TL-2023]